MEISSETLQKLKKIKLFATDFDGVHTNGKVIVREDGVESVVCNRRDGMAYDLLRKYGIKAVVISKETNPVVESRCAKLKIDCYTKVQDGASKAEILREYADKQGIQMSEVLYMDDDINGLAALKIAAVSVSVADGHPSVQSVCDIITTKGGGEGAIREAVDLLLESQNHKLIL